MTKDDIKEEIKSLIFDAFKDGFHSVNTYNDITQNSVDDEYLYHYERWYAHNIELATKKIYNGILEDKES